MIFQQKACPLDNLHTDLIVLVEKKKLNVKAAHYLADLVIDAEQLLGATVLFKERYPANHQTGRQIWEAHGKNLLF